MSEPSQNKPKKPQKLRARLPRGLVDRDAADLAATRAMTETIREVYERYGFEPVETPAFEYTDALGKFLPDQDRPNEGVFSFQDDDEQWVSLRYDLTAPLARYVAEHWDALPKPYRSYRAGYVYRNEKPGPGRFRQFMQFDADTVGSASPAADAEMCMMAADAMEALGFQRGQYVVKVNSRKVLDGMLEAIGLGGDENTDRRLKVLRAIDKHDRLANRGVRLLLGEGRWDGNELGKGDFTPGAGLPPSDIEKLLRWLNFKELFQQFEEGSASFGIPNPYYAPPSEWRADDPRLRWGISGLNRTGVARTPSLNWDWLGALARVFYDNNPTLLDGFSELESICDLVETGNYGKQIQVDPSVVRGLEYYTGAVFEVELLLDTKDEKGRPVRFGSVGGGGRYDGLVSRFRGEPVPATGFSIGVSRLQAALALLNKDKPSKPTYGPVVVTVFPDKNADQAAQNMQDAQSLVQMLREAKVRAELYLGSSKHSLRQQTSYADKRRSPCTITQGPDEKAVGNVVVNDLIAGAGLADIADREEYLKRKAASLKTVARGDLVAEVRALLARHGAS